ncbi:hypothetical protein AAFF_G00337250 [Aldrovandia affinis]|uniref:Uncharacterized protein n=1 Tax=Aldrovandia affinis TaxID=143900 RepID=A0AAD7WPQ3_9TELE|nr:hypothetical protein AAFF_G00337250 [Aldrovandia affinis]
MAWAEPPQDVLGSDSVCESTAPSGVKQETDERSFVTRERRDGQGAKESDRFQAHGVDQVADCGLWNVVPLLFDGRVKLLDIGRNWNTLSYTLIQIIPNMLNGWHVCATMGHPCVHNVDISKPLAHTTPNMLFAICLVQLKPGFNREEDTSPVYQLP